VGEIPQNLPFFPFITVFFSCPEEIYTGYNSGLAVSHTLGHSK